jgi:hypothetical protein
MGAAQIALISGFCDYDAVQSSKKMVAYLHDKVGEDCIWVSEGSKEIGASAGIAFYLGKDKDGKVRCVKIMSDDKDQRPPPTFPGPKLSYLIDHAELEALWAGPAPVLFVTDFLRKPGDWEKDPPALPSNIAGMIERSEFGNRRVFANAAAWTRLYPPEENMETAVSEKR